jgi:peptidoglycan/LPS O-acetylase OafA/YrhL
MDGKRLKFVDGLRGVAAMMVVLFHLFGRTSAAALTSRGYLGVAIFFVLSGFVITAIVGTRRVTAGFLGRFALRRMIRLDIPYWLNIALALGLMAIAVRAGIPKQPVHAWPIAAHLVYLQEFFGYTEINTVYWTLCFEVQFYLALILLLWGAQALHVRWPQFIVVFVALIGFSLLAGMKWIATPAGLMLPYWWAFALGALCYWALVGRVQVRYLAAACVLAACTIFAVSGAFRLAALVTVGLLFVAWRWNVMDRWLSDRVSQFLGRISYSLYLCHPLIGWSAQSLALRFLNQWGALAVGIVASLVSAWLTWRFIERPSIRLSHHVQMDPDSPGARRPATAPSRPWLPLRAAPPAQPSCKPGADSG